MRHTTKSLRGRLTRSASSIANAVRRVVLAATKGGQWNVQGYQLPDLDGTGESTEGDEEDAYDHFGGVQIYARPADADNAEAIVLSIGVQSDHPVIASTRNEDARQRYVEFYGEIEPGELAISNSQGNARVVIKANGDISIDSEGTIFAKSKDGTANPVAFASELNDLATKYNSHIHPATSGTTSPTTTLAEPYPGTSTLKAE